MGVSPLSPSTLPTGAAAHVDDPGFQALPDPAVVIAEHERPPESAVPASAPSIDTAEAAAQIRRHDLGSQQLRARAEAKVNGDVAFVGGPS